MAQAVRNPVRRRAILFAAILVTALAVGGAGGALLAAHFRAQGGVVTTSVRSSSPVPRPASNAKALVQAPYYVSFRTILARAAVVRRTANGQVAGTVSAPAGSGFVGIAAAGSPRSFIVAVSAIKDPNARIRFYRLELKRNGRPGPLRPTRVPAFSVTAGAQCAGQLAGLAVTPDGRTLAASALSNCATGRAGPSRIEIASLASGRVLHTIKPGDDYPLSLSWTAGGDLSYDWRQGVWIIRDAAAPGTGTPQPKLLIARAAHVGGFSEPFNSLITPDGSVVLAVVGNSSGLTENVAAFSARTGKGLRVLLPDSRNPAFCEPLWTSAGARHVLAACGSIQASVDNGHVTRVRSSWRLPSSATPGPPQVAW